VGDDALGAADAERCGGDRPVAPRALTLVVDASVALWASGAGTWEPLAAQALVAPALMWSEATSSLHEAVWRRELRALRAREVLQRLQRAPVRRRAHRELYSTALQIAEQMGWAKTYDSEYLALARLLGARVVTLDARLRRGADRLALVVLPDEL
jgi:predicted nucleic acid-binding protein